MAVGQKYIIGIDLGTTNSTVAYLEEGVDTSEDARDQKLPDSAACRCR